MAELMGRVDGLCRGLGGSMHLVDVEHGLLGATGVVGGNIPMALGSALAARMRGRDAVAVVFFGDGAVQAGQFNESINIATLWSCRWCSCARTTASPSSRPRSSHTNVERVSDVVAPVRPAARDGGRQRGRRGLDGLRRACSRRPARGGARPAGVPDPPAARPLRGRPGPLPRGVSQGRVAGEGPDPAARSARAPRTAGSSRAPRRSWRRARAEVDEAVEAARAQSVPR